LFWPLIALMLEAARTFETSVDIQLRTQHYIPEDYELHTRLRENCLMIFGADPDGFAV
jgi:hypothetical protein